MAVTPRDGRGHRVYGRTNTITTPLIRGDFDLGIDVGGRYDRTSPIDASVRFWRSHETDLRD